MGNALEPGRSSDAILNFRREAVGDLDNLGAIPANEMVMMIVAIRDKFEARRAVAKIEAMNHPHFLKEMHGPINGRQIAFALRERG